MNKGILGFPRNAALQVKSVDARRVTAETVKATSTVVTAGSTATNTGIKLIDEQDLGSLFRPASYTAVQTVSTSWNGGQGNANCATISASVSGSQLSITLNNNCNCVCVCSTDSG